jgi:hypothetical protein
MPHFCDRDDGWPRKRCYIKYNPETGYSCRHWSKSITKEGCGTGMWKLAAKDGSCAEITQARSSYGKNQTESEKK